MRKYESPNTHTVPKAQQTDTAALNDTVQTTCFELPQERV